MNVFADEWDAIYPPVEGWRSNVKRLVARGHTLGVSLYELFPGQTQAPYHFHHGTEEFILVVRGRPTLRMSNGERELAPGDFVHFPIGPEGTHQVINRTGESVRYILGSSMTTPEIVEYPDSGKLAAMARSESQLGQPLWSVHRLDAEVDYFDGEQPRTS
jgi:uncharacterized cupin superfamily protein